MPSKHPWRLAEATLKQVRQHKYQAAILPFGATEPHNLHLPYATDNIEVTEVCDRACGYAWKRGGRVALLPTIPYGADQNMMEFPWTISVDQEQLDGIILSVAQSLEHHGVEKLVVVNGHGGNNFIGGVRSIYRKTKVFISVLNWYSAAAAEGGKDMFEYGGDHADEMETSMIQAIAPELVDMPSADDGAVRVSRFDGALKGWVWYPRPWEKLTTSSGCGYPKAASAAKGRKFMALAEKRMGEFFVQLANAKRDQFFPFTSAKPKAKANASRPKA
jgi:creatinine amidohydrolase